MPSLPAWSSYDRYLSTRCPPNHYLVFLPPTRSYYRTIYIFIIIIIIILIYMDKTSLPGHRMDRWRVDCNCDELLCTEWYRVIKKDNLFCQLVLIFIWSLESPRFVAKSTCEEAEGQTQLRIKIKRQRITSSWFSGSTATPDVTRTPNSW